jgi:hypothetical protein
MSERPARAKAWVAFLLIASSLFAGAAQAEGPREVAWQPDWLKVQLPE